MWNDRIACSHAIREVQAVEEQLAEEIAFKVIFR